MEQQLKEIVAKIGEIEPDFENDALMADDLGIDSFRAVEITFEIESELGVSIPDDRLGEVKAFSDLLRIVTELKGA